MRLNVRNAVAVAIAGIGALQVPGAVAETSASGASVDSEILETVLITAKRADRTSKGATGLNLDVQDTPQSISVVTAEQMEKFGADDINDALRLVTGINVEEWETNRTNYMARGFEIKNTQIDGVGLPNNWGIVTGAMDTFGYEKIEVIRGANGLLTGVGNSSGTINYVRKRPKNVAEGSLGVSGGSFDQRRVEADYSLPFTEDGKWAGRLVAATEDEESWVRGLSNDRAFVYGVIDGQIGERSTLTVGASYQEAHTDGNMWGALTLNYSDGTQAEFDRSASTAQDWTMWNTRHKIAFAEYTVKLAERWDLKASYNYREYSDVNKLFFAYTVTGIDRETGLGLLGWPGNWPTQDDSNLAEVSVDGRFDLFGREHQVQFGTSYSTGKNTQYTQAADPDSPAWLALPSFPYAGNAIPEPEWGEITVDSVTNQRLRREFGAARFSFTDDLAVIVGLNLAEYHRDGTLSGGIPFDQTESEASPYAGITYEFVDDIVAYASYSDIYQPQDQQDITGAYLDPSKGVNYEVGVKADWFDKRLLTTLAWFKAEQKDLATYIGYDADSGQYYYAGVDVKSKGVELEVSGRVNDYFDVVFGFTTLQLEGASGEDIYMWVPRRTVNLALNGKLPQNPALIFGVSGRWQSDTETQDSYTGFTVRQDSYALVDAYVGWDVTNKFNVRANVRNITDEKYITSLYQIGYYGAPRNYLFSASYRF